jgi:inosine-uridine nucleoside N-ribohydrolase
MLNKNTKFFLLIIFILLISSIVITCLRNTYAAERTVTPVMIDTDMMYDDWLAIITVLENPHLLVKEISVSGTGGTHLKPGVNNLLRILDYVKAPNITVAAGIDKPLLGDKAFSYRMRKDTDNFGDRVMRLLPSFPKKSERQASNRNAIDLMYTTLKNSQQRVTILALAPLTDIAQLLKFHPDIKPKISAIYIMGGAIKVSGNLYLSCSDPSLPKEYAQNKRAEWNIFVDAKAADDVFHSGVPVVLVPLDATNKTRLTNKFIDSLKARVNTSNRSLKLFYSILEATRRKHTSLNGLFLWDVVPAVMLGGNSYIATIKPSNLRVALKDQTPMEKRIYGSVYETKNDKKNNSVVYVALDLDKTGFFKKLNYLLSNK